MTARPLLVGIDLGTTTCKATVLTIEGREIARGARPTPWIPVPTGAEFDPIALAEAALEAALEALSRVEGALRAVGVTSMGEAGVLVDRRGEPLTRGIAWHDSRGAAIARRIEEEIGPSSFARHTGLPLGPGWTIAKLPVLSRTGGAPPRGHHWLSVAEWMVRWLGGEELAEWSLASRTGLLDVRARAWWPEGLALAGVDPSIMPTLVPAGTPAGRATVVPELGEAVLSVAGHDQPCGAVGAGATAPSDTFDSCGTAEALLRGIPWPIREKAIEEEAIEAATKRGLTFGCHVLPDAAALLGFFKGGIALKGVLASLGVPETGEERAALDRLAMEVPPGTEPLVEGVAEGLARVVPGGAEYPSPGALWRGTIQATARESSRIVESIERIAGRTGRLVVSGGWARSETFRALKRGIQGAFDHPGVVDAAARGAALLAGLAAGVYASPGAFPVPDEAGTQ